MSIQFNNVSIGKTVIISAPTKPAASKSALDNQIQKLTDLALGKGIPEEKSNTKPSLAEDEVKKNEVEEKEQLVPNVIQAASFPRSTHPKNCHKNKKQTVKLIKLNLTLKLN